MGKVKLGLENLQLLDNQKIAAAFNHELRHVVKDCIDRPGDDRARAVSLDMTVTPECDRESGVCDTVSVEFTVKSAVPNRRSRKFQMAVDAKGVIVVNPESPENVRQGTLDEA